MKKIIGFTLFGIWMMLFMLMLVEPKEETMWNEENLNDWTGWVYVILVLGLPFVWTRDYWWNK